MPEDIDQKTVYFARTNFRGQDRIFGVKTRDRRQHMYIVGKTGTGKTVLLKNLAMQDVYSGAGLAIVDPHGEFAEEVMSAIPPHRINDVVYFNPADTEYPLGFNVLEVPDPKYKHVVASDLMGIFTKIWANVWSARMEYILQNCVLALLDTPGTTLLGIPRILVDREYRAKIVGNVKDPVVRSFWTQEYENYTDRLRSEAISPIQNKVGQFLNTSMVRNIVGQPKSGFNVQDVMNSGKILIVNVSKGRIGEDNSSLLGAMIITKLQLGAMERVRVPEKERKDFYLYVDEFQNFSTDSFASVLSEARKYRLCLTLAHQYIGQLVTDNNTKVRDAIFGNVGTMLVFRVGAADAEYLETEFTPEFLPEDIVNLPNYHVYLKLMVDGITSRPFSATTLPPIPLEDSTDAREKVIKVSRERYAAEREKVEERIYRWSGMLPGGDMESGDGGVPMAVGGPGAGAQRSMSQAGAKEEYEAVCASCGKSIKVPFKPDPRRPVYCPNCLKRVKEGEVLPITLPRQEAKPVGQKIVGKGFGDSLGALGIEFTSPVTDAPVKRTEETRMPQASSRASQPSTVRPKPSVTLPRVETRPTPHADASASTQPDRTAQNVMPLSRPVFGATASPVPTSAPRDPNIGMELYTVTCTRCGKETSVNFKPDGRRPVYCKLCLPIIRSEEMKGVIAPPQFRPASRSLSPSAEPRPMSARPATFAKESASSPQATYAPRSVPARPPKTYPPMRASVPAIATPPVRHISLKDALGGNGVSFTGKKLRKKEVNLDDLREVLKESIEESFPDAPDPDGVDDGSPQPTSGVHRTTETDSNEEMPEELHLSPGSATNASLRPMPVNDAIDVRKDARGAALKPGEKIMLKRSE